MTDLQSLTLLGLNAYEAAAYVALLSRPELTSAEVAGRANIPRQRVYDVLDSLVAKGLCIARNATRKTYTAIDPKIALDLLAKDRAAALERQRQEAQAVAARLAAELSPVFTSGRGQDDPLAYVEVLSGPTRIAHRALSLAEGAKRSVNSCIKRPMILSEDQNWKFMKTPLRRGLKYRALYSDDALDDAELSRWMKQFGKWGLDIRVAAELPLKMQVFDEEVVLISMQDPTGGQPSFTAVIIYNRGAVAMFNLAFEQIWVQARPFKEDGWSEKENQDGDLPWRGHIVPERG